MGESLALTVSKANAAVRVEQPERLRCHWPRYRRWAWSFPVEEYLERLGDALSMLECVAAGEGGSILNQAAAMTHEAAEAIDPQVRAHLAWAFTTAAEAQRRAREVWGLATNDPARPPYGSPGELAAAGLPLNRKERFYTGTVLPQIIASADFTHMHRFLSWVH